MNLSRCMNMSFEDSSFGILERWKSRRDVERVVRESEVREMDEQQLDRL